MLEVSSIWFWASKAILLNSSILSLWDGLPSFEFLPLERWLFGFGRYFLYKGEAVGMIYGEPYIAAIFCGAIFKGLFIRGGLPFINFPVLWLKILIVPALFFKNSFYCPTGDIFPLPFLEVSLEFLLAFLFNLIEVEFTYWFTLRWFAPNLVS